MRFITRLVDRILKKENLEKPIGRWFRDTCEKTIGRKVDLSNEDHCGPCGEYALLKTTTSNQKNALYTVKEMKTYE